MVGRRPAELRGAAVTEGPESSPFAPASGDGLAPPARPFDALLRYLLVRWVAGTVAVAVAALVLPGIDVDGGLGTVIGIALVLGIVTAVVGSVARLVALPLILLTLGLFLVVINAGLLLLTDALVGSLDIDGFWWAVAGALVISAVMAVVE